MDQINTVSVNNKGKNVLLFPFIISLVIIFILIVVTFLLANTKKINKESVAIQKATPVPSIIPVLSENTISFKGSGYTFEMKDTGKALDSQVLSGGSCSGKGYFESDLADCSKFGKNKYPESQSVNIEPNGLYGCAVTFSDCGAGSCNHNYQYYFAKGDLCYEVDLSKTASTCDAYDPGPEKNKCEQYKNIELPALIKTIENSFKVLPTNK